MEREVDMTMLQAAQGSLKSGTSDYQSNMKRSKFFFGYGYVGYQYGKKPVVKSRQQEPKSPSSSNSMNNHTK